MIYIVIPVFNRWHFTKACLESLETQSYREFETIVVDHGSTDDTTTLINRLFPTVTVLKGDDSLWWTGATNLGVKYVLGIDGLKDSDFLLTLNNDLVISSDYLEKLLEGQKENFPCVVGSMSVDIEANERIDFAGVLWNSLTAKYIRLSKVYPSLLDINRRKLKYIDTDLLPGRGTLFSIECIKKVGLFDEVSFPHYVADEDYSLACRKQGYKLVVATQAIVFSHVNATGAGSKQQLSASMFFRSFLSIRSTNSIRRRWLWARKNSDFPYLYIIFDYSRIIYSFFRNKLSKANFIK